MALAGVVVGSLAALWFLAAAQGALRKGPPPVPTIACLEEVTTNDLIILSPTESFPPASAPACKPQFKIQPSLPSARPHRSPVLPGVPAGAGRNALTHFVLISPAPPRLPPGVYETAPYSCLVVVPGPYPDDRCIVGPGAGDFSMPIVTPGLTFIPRDASMK